MARSTFFSLLALATGTFAQTTTSFADPMTGITFQAFTDSTTGYRFGIALPENPTTDFIGQLHAPITNGSGWVGADLGAPMVNELLIVAYSSGNQVVSSLREATAYANPPVYSGNTSISLLPIAKGTAINSQGLTFTFVCRGCITNSELSFSSSDSGTVFGWAISTDKVATPSSPSSALNFHAAGYGDYGVNLTEAKSAQYAQWAALASAASNSTSNSTGASTGSATGPSSVLAGSAIPSSSATSAAGATSAPSSVAAGAPAPSSTGSCHKHKKGSKPQTGSVTAVPIGDAVSVASSSSVALPTAPSSSASGAGVGAGAGAVPFAHRHHHHHHHNGTVPGFNGTGFGGEGEHRSPRFDSGAGASSRQRAPFARKN
ncbi:MAG: hypothetical protein M1822_009770 [Bathelium mastoideum]|nr:MAG: hypothetical protein M1822_009770 [Bathelium mastoideum]